MESRTVCGVRQSVRHSVLPKIPLCLSKERHGTCSETPIGTRVGTRFAFRVLPIHRFDSRSSISDFARRLSETLGAQSKKKETVVMKSSLKMFFVLVLTLLNQSLAHADTDTDAGAAKRAKFFKQLEEMRFKVRIGWIEWTLRRYDMSCVAESKNPELAKRFSFARMDINGNKIAVEPGKPVMLSNESDRTRIIGIFVDDKFLAAARVEYGDVGFERNREQSWYNFRSASGYIDATSPVGYKVRSNVEFTDTKDGHAVGDYVLVTCTADLNMAGVLPL